MYSLILYGRRFCELQKLRILRFAVNPSENAAAFSSFFSSKSVSDVSITRDGQKGHSFTVSYLVGSLGLSTKLAESISTRVSFEEKINPDSVLNLLRSHGFRDFQICGIITDYPQLLIADSERSLAPKLQFLQSRGASSSELTEIVSKFPKILGIKKDKAISVYYDFVKEIIKADKSFEHKRLCHSSLPHGIAQENKIRNVLVLRELGVPQRFLFSLIFSKSQTVCGKERFEETLKKVVEMGFDPNNSKFVVALRMLQQMSDKKIQEKVQVYKKLGFTVDDVWAMFKKNPTFMALSEKKILISVETFLGLGFTRDEFLRMVKRFPQCIGYSAETVKKKTEFVVKQMNWPLKAVALFPQVLSYSMEKRIVPRCNVIKALMSKGYELPSLSSVLACTGESFLNKYVMKQDDKKLVAELMDIFTRDHVS